MVEGKEWSGKLGRKWNIAEVATEARNRKMESEGETVVRGMEVKPSLKDAAIEGPTVEIKEQ